MIAKALRKFLRQLAKLPSRSNSEGAKVGASLARAAVAVRGAGLKSGRPLTQALPVQLSMHNLYLSCTAIHIQLDPCNIRSLAASQEKHGVGDFFGSAKPLHGNSRLDIGRKLILRLLR